MDNLPTPDGCDAYEAIFGSLAHSARRQILMTINFEGGSMTAGAIARLFEHSWPTTTRHLKVLSRAGLLRTERRGRERVYHIDLRRVRLVQDWIAWFFKPATPGRGVASGREEQDAVGR